ncbi:alpha/beta hydrolase [Saprospira sp. CCB-QB6]|uniref:RHS repeat domain-containing protein n=1 Tax=Saprospira sp. CCB-QB6 TaxID=3023936 RepID=UPI00234A53BF|nr:RHS repeat-associated core domain-containing protein [Saprospira sp. CCB-QB6]WCL81584.1 alpha/beta hydrolase [Saprospira sp. CCB-QB6]
MGQDSSQTGQADYYLAQVSSASLYYPFGWEMPGRKFVSGEEYRFGFNGKEDDRDWGTQNIQDYGFRLYNPSIGKFLSVDPLAKDYPELTCYQFASNTPLWAIDLDGLEAYFVHGTNSGNKSAWIKPSKEPNGHGINAMGQLMRLTNNETADVGFSWTGSNNRLWNNKKDRAKAAERLVDHVMATMNGKEDITLVGHSHGGNVALQAVPILRKRLDENGYENEISIHLITVATPADNSEGSPENPKTILDNWAFNERDEGLSTQLPFESHSHLYNNEDVVQTKGASAMGKLRSLGKEKSFDRQYTLYQGHNGGDFRNFSIDTRSVTRSGIKAHYMHNMAELGLVV